MAKTKRFSVKELFLSMAVVASVAAFGMAGAAYADSGLGVSVNVGANGEALVRGAQVTAVSDSQVDAKTSWGDAILNWVVKTDSDTNYVGKNGKDTNRSDIAVGDTVSFSGKLDTAVNGLSVKAKTVKDWSKAEATKMNAKLSGSVNSINTSLNSFVVANGNSTTTVETSSSTTFRLNGENATFADLFVNAKVKLMGMFSASSSVFTATAVDIASSTKKHDDRGKGNDNDFRAWIRSHVWFNLFGKH